MFGIYLTLKIGVFSWVSDQPMSADSSCFVFLKIPRDKFEDDYSIDAEDNTACLKV